MARVLAEEMRSIRFVRPGPEGEGTEFDLTRKDGTREYHQVKRQHGRRGVWSIADLAHAGVLAPFWRHLSSGDGHCVFASLDSAHELRELAERALKAETYEEFETEYLKGEQSGKFANLCQAWGGCDSNAAYSALKRVGVEVYSEEGLHRETIFRLERLVNANPENVHDLLAQSALVSIGNKRTAHDLWKFLNDNGYHRRDITNDPSAIAAVDELTKVYVKRLRADSINRKPIRRTETDRIIEHITGPIVGASILASGVGGSGKSGVLLQITEDMAQRGWPVLVLQMDRWRDFTSPANLGKEMGLPASPVVVLEAIASGGDCLFVIDQLDAYSLASGRDPENIDCVSDLLDQARRVPHLHVAMACRSFDVENDRRIRAFVEPDGFVTEVNIGVLSQSDVELALIEMGLDVGSLSQAQMDILSVPMHLKIMQEVVRSGHKDAPVFRSRLDLFNTYWDRKQDDLTTRLKREPKWVEVVDALCDDMVAKHSQSAHKDVVATYRRDANAMVSENVLHVDGPRLSFFHQSFFDYAFARRFVARGKRLLEMLTDREQHLSRRNQVRQVLEYARDNDREAYLNDVMAILASTVVRFHIKQVVFGVLAQLSDPSPEEWQIVEPYFVGADAPLAREAQRVITALPWFRLLDSSGVIEERLHSAETQSVDQTINYLAQIQQTAPDRVAEIVEPFYSSDMPWRNRMVFLVQSPFAHGSRPTFELTVRLMQDGSLDDLGSPFDANGRYPLFMYNLAREHPDWVCEFLDVYLKRALATSLSVGEANPFAATIAGWGVEDTFVKVAKATPGFFVKRVLPFMLKVMRQNVVPDARKPRRDTVWKYRIFSGAHSIEGNLLKAMEAALSSLAVDVPTEFRRWAAMLAESGMETASFLLIRGYAANGDEFAEEAAQYIICNPARLNSGYTDGEHWAGRQLLDAITPTCSEPNLQSLESLLINYQDEPRSHPRKRIRRPTSEQARVQLELLNGIVVVRRTPQVKLKIGELQRKLGITDVAPPRGIFVSMVTSPLPELAAVRMSDEQWLRAILKYADDEGDHSSDGTLRGGAFELAQDLQHRAAEDPERFAKLLALIPDSANLHYFNFALMGLAANPPDLPTVLDVCRRCHALPQHPCGRTICDLLAKVADSDLPDEAMRMVAWYATEAKDPLTEEWRQEAPGGGVYYDGEPFSAGLNSDRGNAAWNMATLIQARPDRVRFFQPFLERMVDDPSIAVRAMVALPLTPALNFDRDLAVSLFLRLCNTNDVLLGTDGAERFLSYAQYSHFAQLAPIIERALDSQSESAVTAGARIACRAALNHAEADPLARRCVEGSVTMRRAAASVFSRHVTVASFRSLCEEMLVRLFNDEDEDVGKEAASTFWNFPDDQLSECTGLVEAFAESAALADEPHSLLHALETSATRLPDATCLVCERLLAAGGDRLADMRTRFAADADTISKLVVRTYAQTEDEAIRTRCLNVIDDLARFGAYGLDDALSALDRG